MSILPHQIGKLPTYSPRLPLKILPQAAKPEAPLPAPSVLSLIQPISGKRQKTSIGDMTFPILVLMPNCFKIEKFKIWLAIRFLEMLPEVHI